MARPMPRDAPVTSATRPERSNMWRDEGIDRREIVGAAEALDRGGPVNLAHEAAQHRPRPHLNIRCDAFRRKAAHHGLPAYGRRDLRDERLDRGGRVALRL